MYFSSFWYGGFLHLRKMSPSPNFAYWPLEILLRQNIVSSEVSIYCNYFLEHLGTKLQNIEVNPEVNNIKRILWTFPTTLFQCVTLQWETLIRLTILVMTRKYFFSPHKLINQGYAACWGHFDFMHLNQPFCPAVKSLVRLNLGKTFNYIQHLKITFWWHVFRSEGKHQFLNKTHYITAMKSCSDAEIGKLRMLSVMSQQDHDCLKSSSEFLS